jgi:uncharacterized membrane protein
MTENGNNKDRYYRRVEERHFWARLGVVLLIFCASIFVVSTIMSFVIDIPFILYYNLVGVSISGMILGALFAILLARLGWSKSRLLDLLFNRVGIVFIITGQVLSTLQISMGYSLDDTNYTVAMLIAGVILVLFGIRFHSPTLEDPRIEPHNRSRRLEK